VQAWLWRFRSDRLLGDPDGWSPLPYGEAMPNFDKICFVIMPFGKKRVKLAPNSGGSAKTRTVDFDQICDSIFKPAIAAVPLPLALCKPFHGCQMASGPTRAACAPAAPPLFTS